MEEANWIGDFVLFIHFVYLKRNIVA